MSRLIAVMILALAMAMPSVGFAGWAESVGAVDRKVERIRSGHDKVLNRTLKAQLKRLCETEKICGGASYEDLTARMLGDAGFMAKVAEKLKAKLGKVEPADLNQMIQRWIIEACKPGGFLRNELESWVKEISRAQANAVFDSRKAELVPKAPTVSSAMQMIVGVNGQLLLREQGYFPVLVGFRSVVRDYADIEFALMFGPGRDWERDAHMDFVFGARGVVSLELATNFNARLGVVGALKPAVRDGNASSGDIGATVGLELEFASWLYLAVDGGLTWSLRKDAEGAGLVVSGGPIFRIF